MHCCILGTVQSLASNLFASSIIPYAGFLYHLSKSGKTPPLVLFGFRFLLVFVFSTIVAGIYGTSTPPYLLFLLPPPPSTLRLTVGCVPFMQNNNLVLSSHFPPNR